MHRQHNRSSRASQRGHRTWRLSLHADASTFTFRCVEFGNVEDFCEIASADNNVIYGFLPSIQQGLDIIFEGISFRSTETETPNSQTALIYLFSYGSTPPKARAIFRNTRLTASSMIRLGAIKAKGIHLIIEGGTFYDFRTNFPDKFDAFGYLVVVESYNATLEVTDLTIQDVRTERLFYFEGDATVSNICVNGASESSRTFTGLSSAILTGENNYFANGYEDDICNEPGRRRYAFESGRPSCLDSGTEVTSCGGVEESAAPTASPVDVALLTAQPALAPAEAPIIVVDESSPTRSPTTTPTASPTASPTDNSAPPTDAPIIVVDESSPSRHPTSSPTNMPTANKVDSRATSSGTKAKPVATMLVGVAAIFGLVCGF